jgi:hypothetical protein
MLDTESGRTLPSAQCGPHALTKREHGQGDYIA